MGKKPLPVKKDRPVADITKFFDKRRFSKPADDKLFGVANRASNAAAQSVMVNKPAPEQRESSSGSGRQNSGKQSSGKQGSGKGQDLKSTVQSHPAATEKDTTSEAPKPAKKISQMFPTNVPSHQKEPRRAGPPVHKFRQGFVKATPVQNFQGSQGRIPVAQNSQAVAGTSSQPEVHCGSLPGNMLSSQRHQIPVTQGLAMAYSQDLDLEGERVSYQPPASNTATSLPVIGEDEETLKDHLISAVSKVPGRNPVGLAEGALQLAAANSCRSQDAFFEELLLLPPPVMRCREDTPSRPIHHRRRPSGSNLKLQSSLKPLTKTRETDSPSCGTPNNSRLDRRPSRVTFNPSVSFAMQPTPSSCSYSGSSRKQKRQTRVKSLIGSVQKHVGSGSKPKSYKRKSLMDLLDQVEMLMQEPGQNSPVTEAVTASGPHVGAQRVVDEEDTGFVRASQEIDRASQEDPAQPVAMTHPVMTQTNPHLPVILEEEEGQVGSRRGQGSSKKETMAIQPEADQSPKSAQQMQEQLRAPDQQIVSVGTDGEGVLPAEVEKQLEAPRAQSPFQAQQVDDAGSLLEAAGKDSPPGHDVVDSGLGHHTVASSQQPSSLHFNQDLLDFDCRISQPFSKNPQQYDKGKSCGNTQGFACPTQGTRLLSGPSGEFCHGSSQVRRQRLLNESIMRSPPLKEQDRKRSRHSAPSTLQPRKESTAVQRKSMFCSERHNQENWPPDDFHGDQWASPPATQLPLREETVLKDVTDTNTILHPRKSPAKAKVPAVQLDPEAGMQEANVLADNEKRLGGDDTDASQPAPLTASLAECPTVFPPLTLAAPQAPEGDAPHHLRSRCVVLDRLSFQHEVQLRAMKTVGGQEIIIHLEDGWAETEVSTGDTINLIASIEEKEDGLHAWCNYRQGILILHPDLLLSGTLVSGSCKCPRDSVIQENFGGSSSKSAVQGTILHELLQAALTLENPSEDALYPHLQAILLKNAEKMIGVQLEEYQAQKALEDALPTMLSWIRKFKQESPLPDSIVSCGQERQLEGFCVPEVVDIEESVWAPKFGLKGMIDASVQTKFVRQHQDRVNFGGPKTFNGLSRRPKDPQKQHHSAPAHYSRPTPGQQAMAPFEFKTGKAHHSHKAQVLLYLLLMEERYGTSIERGLLQYLNDQPPEVIQRSNTELSALFIQRNMLAAHLVQQSLPEMKRAEWACKNCFHLTQCMLLHKAVDGGGAESSGVPTLFEQKSGHLTQEHASFLQLYLKLIDLECSGQVERRAELWNLKGSDREQTGRCLSDLVYVEGSYRAIMQTDADRQWSCTFQAASCPNRKNLQELGFAEGELVVLSIEGKHSCLARGSILGISEQTVTLRMSKKLRECFLNPASGSWRIDKDEVSSVFVKMRANLLDLMDPDKGTAKKLRSLMIDFAPPQFVQPTEEMQSLHPHLNAEQQLAVNRIVNARDYALVLGLPGTGKTSTIVAAVMGLLSKGKSVLLTSYTNSAVDNIMLKLAVLGAHMLRLGRSEGVHPLLQPYMLGGSNFPNKRAADMQAVMRDVRLVGSTALGVDSPLLSRKVFDMCIVDEAGQITLPACIAPLLKSTAFTLVGDHYQLPPLVQKKQAAEGGLDVSLFRKLWEAHPQAIVELKTQYRMAEDIQLLSNSLVYNGKLQCGSPSVANAVLATNVDPSMAENLPFWLTQILQPERRVIFLNTDIMGAPESRVGGAIYNDVEARIALQVVGALAECQILLQDIGIISPYRQQVTQIQRITAAQGFQKVEVMTVDKCQGRDKAVIIISMVRSNAEKQAGSLLADWRRINVALTRAQKKLVIVGSAETISAIPLLEQLCLLCKERSWLISLSEDHGKSLLGS